MLVAGIPVSNVDPTVNIATTAGTVRLPGAVRELYERWLQKGVSFTKEGGAPAALKFIERHFEDDIAAFAAAAFRDAERNRLAFLGGDHSITFFTFNEFRRHYGENAVIISLDAHPDLCAKGSAAPLHSDWLRRLIDGDLDPRRIIGIGWRDAEADEIAFQRQKGITVYPAAYFRVSSVKSLLYELKRDIAKKFGRACHIYLTIDMDVLDPSLCPAVTTPSPAGLDQHQFTLLIAGLAAFSRLRAFDVVEIDPARDMHNFSLLWVLKVLREMA